MNTTARCRRLFSGVVGLGLVWSLCGCSQVNRELAIGDVSVSLPQITGKERPLRRAGSPAELLAIQPGGSQTVLIACEEANAPADRPFWQRNVAYVLVLDGAPGKGAVEITPDNGRFIENAAWLPARSPYVGLEGRINIISVTAKGVLADCAVRNVIARTGDPVYPLRGLHTFKFASPDVGMLARCGVQLGAPAGQ